MKFGVLNKSTILNRFVLDTLQRNITHLAVITRKTNIKLGILKGGGGNWKRATSCYPVLLYNFTLLDHSAQCTSGFVILFTVSFNFVLNFNTE